MMRPLTCLCLAAAAVSGLILYQEKHRAQLLDREIVRMVKQADQSRDRIALLRAEWALLNEPDRLSGLATQYLALQSLAPAQFSQATDLPNRLPAPVLTPPPAPVELPVTIPIAAVPPARPTVLAAAAPAGAVKPPAAGPVVAVAVPAKPPALLAAAHPALHRPAKPDTDTKLASTAPKPEEARVPAALPPPRPVYAPIMPAYVPGQAPVVHAPTVQTAAATTSTFAPGAYGGAASPYVGSALGMARSLLAAPVPVSPATALGTMSGR